ncbi:MAG: class I SAM-dependent methyltransferase [Gammaproteobacteria bacterium]|nr:class I SAM-dependent methyltransferase [Gammaproteobacteria bacterium]
MKLSNVVPWGRSLKEYKEMFALSNTDLEKKILGCSDGPACFNAEVTNLGGSVISVDPVYEFNSEQIRTRIDEAYPQIMEQVSKNKNEFIWRKINNIDELGKIRMEAMKRFLADYDLGKKAGRYINASLPALPFSDGEFELALCSHYLFLYSEHISQKQHVLSMKELCRVANEVRIYPLISMTTNEKSLYLEPVMSALKEEGIKTSLVPVEHEFQKGAIEMMVAKCV